MTVTVAITIDGITREGIGTGLADSEMGIKKAEHDALKRAAVKFGIARGLYHKESEIIEREGSVGDKKDDSGFPSNPLANGLSDLVTPKQLGMINAVAREKGYDPDEECRKLLQCGADELSRRAASCFIGHLQQLDQRTFAPTSGANNETHSDQAERWRKEMADGYAEVGLDPSKVLAEYDTRCNMIDDKRNAHTATMKKILLKKIEQVKHVFADSQWTSSDIAKELKKHGITGAIENAKPEAINSIWADYKQARMI
jgi:hypothetical protein